MAVLEVACPGCKAGLKAPDNMAGKKARCKKCGTSFVIPGAAADPAGESQMLSVVDTPPNSTAAAPPEPKPAAKPKPVPAPAPQAVEAVDPLSFDDPAPATSGDPFD